MTIAIRTCGNPAISFWHGRQRSSSIWSNLNPQERMVTGSMTLEGVGRMYGLDETGLRRALGIGPEIPMNRSIRDIREAAPGAVPSPDAIEHILGRHIRVRVPQAPALESSRPAAPGTGRTLQAPAHPGVRGGKEVTSSGTPMVLRGSTTLIEALAYSGKTLEQVKNYWDLAFLDSQTNLGNLAQTIGVSMRELRDYFQR